MALTPRERAMCELADTRYKYEAIKADAIRRTWDMTPARFWVAVNGILDRPDALEDDAMLVRRLLRKREARAVARGGSAAFPVDREGSKMPRDGYPAPSRGYGVP